jgi:hypothetical protein
LVMMLALAMEFPRCWRRKPVSLLRGKKNRRLECGRRAGKTASSSGLCPAPGGVQRFPFFRLRTTASVF